MNASPTKTTVPSNPRFRQGWSDISLDNRWACRCGLVVVFLLVGVASMAETAQARDTGAGVETLLSALDVSPDSPTAFPVSQLETLDGDVRSLGRSGSPTIINFWASWCEPCRHELKDLSDRPTEGSSSSVRILAVNVGQDTGTIRAFLREHELNLTVIPGSPGKKLYEDLFAGSFVQLPRTVFLDRDGRIVARKNGAINFGTESFRKVLRKL